MSDHQGAQTSGHALRQSAVTDHDLARWLPAALTHTATRRLRPLPGTVLDPLLRAAHQPGHQPTLGHLLTAADAARVGVVELVEALLADRTGDLTVIDTTAARDLTGAALQPLRTWARTNRGRTVALDQPALTELAAACGLTATGLHTTLTTHHALRADTAPDLDLTHTVTPQPSRTAVAAGLGRHLQAARRIRSLPRDQVAATIGSSPEVLERWERGDRLIDIRLLTWLHWCRTLGVGPPGALHTALAPTGHTWITATPSVLLRTHERSRLWGRWARHTLHHRGPRITVHTTALTPLTAALNLDADTLREHLHATATDDLAASGRQP